MIAASSPRAATPDGSQKIPLALLLVEDSELDAAFVVHILERGGYRVDYERVETPTGMAAALQRRRWDLIISDHDLPSFSAPEALLLSQRDGADIPFIILSGTIGETAAVAAMRAGAHDYLLKDDTARLVPAVARELREAEVRRSRKQAESNTAALLSIAYDLSGTLDLSEVLARGHRRTAQALGCDAVATFYFDAERRTFRIIAHHGIASDLESAAREIEFVADDPFEGRLARGEIVVIDDTSGHPWLSREPFCRFPIASLIAAPLRVRDRPLGALVAYSAAPKSFGANQIHLFAGIAHQLAVAIATTDLYRKQQEQVELSGALARVGRELISSRYAPAMLDRLCRLTTEVIGCDCSHTFLWRASEEVFLTVAGYGDTPEQAEALRVLETPAAPIAGLLQQLAEHDVVQVLMSEPQQLIPAALPIRYGIRSTLYIALRRDNELVAILTACYRRDERFSAVQERIGVGIGQLASMALDNVQLMEELERANRLKSEFVATMSHELRTPLNIILGYNDLMLDEEFGILNGDQRDTLQRLGGSARQLLDLVSATLDLSRIEAGREPLQLSSVAPGDLVRKVAAESESLCNKADLDFVVEVAADLPTVRTDAVKLAVVLRNVIENAAKFTARGEVRVQARLSDGGVLFAVSDTGIGIEVSALPIIFEPFRQVDASSTSPYGGVGLGLYITRRILDLLHGRITAESTPGVGTRFEIWLPLDAESVEP